MVTPLQYVEAPAGQQPLPYGLLSVAVVDDRPASDVHWQLGYQYEPDYCGPAFVTEGACATPDLGTVVASVDDSRGASIAVDGNPTGSYDIDWGDGSDPVTDTTPDGETHTYAADGTYTIVLTGPDAYVATATVHVVDGVASTDVDARVASGFQPVDGITTVEGFPFVVYHLLQCKAVGSESRIAERARTGLMGGESRAVESVLAHQLATNTDAVDLTTADGALDPTTALARLLQYATQHYGGTPVIHADPGTVTYLGENHTVSREGRQLQTLIGAPVAAGAGYYGWNGPGDTPTSDPGTTWMWVTGAVMLKRAADIQVRPQQHTNPADNVVQALAARPYAASVECVLAAVQIIREDDGALA